VAKSDFPVGVDFPCVINPLKSGWSVATPQKDLPSYLAVVDTPSNSHLGRFAGDFDFRVLEPILTGATTVLLAFGQGGPMSSHGESGCIEMSVRERDRLKVLHGVVQGERRQKEAARLLRISMRQVRRLVRRLEEAGDQGLIHRQRSRSGSVPTSLASKVHVPLVGARNW
jgi:hypothetical protein